MRNWTACTIFTSVLIIAFSVIFSFTFFVIEDGSKYTREAGAALWRRSWRCFTRKTVAGIAIRMSINRMIKSAFFMNLNMSEIYGVIVNPSCFMMTFVCSSPRRSFFTGFESPTLVPFGLNTIMD